MMVDPISDMLTRIRNAVRGRHPRVDIPSSLLKIEIARILKEEGYIATYKVVEEAKPKKTLRVFLKYGAGRRNVISDLQRVSRPGRRVYVGKTEIKPVLGGTGINILSTPQGLMTGSAARRAGLGGEVLCEVW
ncbi:MAG TPA: 30S ribosomal protein S8 [Candidatus Dormibacteraeota bacterium]|nr:30S ribosomal protein S8 [Candidatus Dormibacteraeota bacterium]